MTLATLQGKRQWPARLNRLAMRDGVFYGAVVFPGMERPIEVALHGIRNARQALGALAQLQRGAARCLPVTSEVACSAGDVVATAN